MKKSYVKPEWEIIILTTNDIITASGEFGYDPDGILDNEFNDAWDW